MGVVFLKTICHGIHSTLIAIVEYNQKKNIIFDTECPIEKFENYIFKPNNYKSKKRIVCKLGI